MNVGQAKAALGLPVSAAPAPAPVLPGDQPQLSVITGGKVDPTQAQKSAVSIRLASRVGGSMIVMGCGSMIKKRGKIPNEPDEDDIELLEKSLEEGLRSEYGDLPLPWWIGVVLASGGVYMGMNHNAKLIAGKKTGPVTQAFTPPEKELKPDKSEPENVKDDPPKTADRKVDHVEEMFATTKPPEMKGGDNGTS